MSFKTTVIVGIVCLIVGAAASWLISHGVWDAELQRQLAEKDKILADIQNASKTSKEDLDKLESIHMKMDANFASALDELGKASKSNSALKDKVRSLLDIVDALYKNYDDLSEQTKNILTKAGAQK